ncbi:MAG: hypothetical protein GY749_00820, partial [Desulfobacteraceae bacterium]|nr:hypothetical protein [Desulfobacteraceae bacterium]
MENYAVIRELVGAAFDDEVLVIFCYDNFSDVAEQFTAGQTRKARIQLLIDYVKRKGLTDRLLTGVQKTNPYQYEKFESRLKSLGPGQVAGQPSNADRTEQKKSETAITYNVNGASAGVIGQNARVYGGVHYHYHSPPASDQEKHREKPVLSEPRPHADIKNLIHPGGAVGTDSALYIKRAADEEVSAGISRPRGLVTVWGARQTGKTSLIMQVYVNAQDSDMPLRPVFVDFQSLPHSDFESLGTIWKAVASETENQLGLDPKTWDHGTRYDRNLLRLSDRIFRESDIPVLFCLDEADRVFSSPVKSDFFASVRAFYNRGAFDPVWKNVRWLLSTSSEPAFFIEDMTQSPFNIGLRVELASFTFDETR